MEDDDYGIISNLNKLFDEYALYEAVEQKNYKRFNSLIHRRDFVVDHADDSGRSLLMQLATMPNGYKFAKELLKKGASVHLKDKKFGYSFLHLAARARRIDNVKIGQLIIENGADVDDQDASGLTPLYLACLEGNQKWIYMLLYYGANASIISYAGLTPLNVLSPSLTRRDDYDLLVDVMFSHTFDSSLSSVSLSALGSAMWKDSPLILNKILENTSHVSYDDDNIDYFCHHFGDIKGRHFELFLEKCEDVVENLVDAVDLLNVVLEVLTSTNIQEMYNIFDCLLFSKHASRLIHNTTVSTFTITKYIEGFASADQKEEIKKRIFVMLSYGLDVTSEDLETVYRHYGYCDLFRTLLHMDFVHIEDRSLSSFVRMYCDLSFSVEDCHEDVLSVTRLLGYFNHPRLKELCLSTSEDVKLAERVTQMSQIPCLVELSRNATRKHVINRFKIGSCKHFYAVLNGLPIDRITRGILALERRIY